MNGLPTIYADDTCFLYHSKNKESLQLQMKEDLEKYSSWLKEKKLVMNESKTSYMIFKPPRKVDIFLDIEINSLKIGNQ